MTGSEEAQLPTFWPRFARGFQWYCGSYVKKHFHAVRLSRSSEPLPDISQASTLFLLNHPSWWDIIGCVLLTKNYPQASHFAPIDRQMLPKYKFFQKLGFFGVDASISGTKEFLRIGKTIFGQSGRCLWVTGQGEFQDPRQRPVVLRHGIAHLLASLPNAQVVTVAVEYPFWNESKPEMLLRVGQTYNSRNSACRDKKEWQVLLENALTENMDQLAREAISRDVSRFTTIVSGKSGVGGPYDWYRSVKSLLTGQKINNSHMDQ